MPAFLLVMIGGAVGAVLRYWAGVLTLHQFGPGFPWGTLTVNLVGGFLMGLLAGGLARLGGNESLRLLLGVGVLGGFTTFSAFSLDAATLFERGQLGLDAAYILASVVGSILALFLGLWIARVTA
jgi:CrcB protein